MNVLIIGGTRNLGPGIVERLLRLGYRVTIFNRGLTANTLPKAVESLRGDRTIPDQLRSAVEGRDFDVVVDTTLYKGDEARAAVGIFSGHVGRYLFISTGQVYLVRVGLQKPFKEKDYFGPVMSSPPVDNKYHYENWLYGVDKRAAEDVFAEAWQKQKFPYTSLRLPMVHSERDHYHRVENYLLRLRDRGPILLPAGEEPLVRHVYGDDVIMAVQQVITAENAAGQAYNISQNEIVPLREFLKLLAEMAGVELQTQYIPRPELEKHGLIPDCSPFSGAWMSMLENQRSINDLGMSYTPLSLYLRRLVEHFSRDPKMNLPGYQRRALELEIARATGERAFRRA